MGEIDKRVCRAPACSLKDMEVRTEAKECIACGGKLQGTGRLGLLFDDLGKGLFG